MLNELSGKPEANRVIGVDTSTKSIAYAIIEDGVLMEYDEVVFKGATLHEKIQEAAIVGRSLVAREPDFVMVEQAIYMNSYSVVIKLAYFVGVILGAVGAAEIPLDDIVPINWMKYIGNPNWTKEERAAVKRDNKGKSASWVRTELRRMRKQRTQDIVNAKYGTNISNDNIADAVGIAMYAWEVSTKHGN